MDRDLLYQLALSLTPNIGPVQARLLVEHFGNAENIFKAKFSQLLAIEGVGEVRAKNIKCFDNYSEAESEIDFLKRNSIQPIFITNENYPRRLLNCYDSPILLFYKGTANLNSSKIISIVGTRKHTEYGKQITEKLISDLAALNILIVSGLAYGIDALAHKISLKNNLPTVGVLAHGLDHIYPYHHTSLANEMIANGGLLTEFRSGSKPDKHNFPARNRIVAGMSDATVVIETGIKGGSMITAELADGYNKDVFAFPGKTTDNKSAGCNYLIRKNKAILLTDAQELIEVLGWEEKLKSRKNNQRVLFIDLTAEEKVIVEILNEKETVHIDELFLRSNLSSSKVAAAILHLELQNVINSLPGKRYSLT